jgi:transcriptional regulator with XRE-family HTH domain
MGTRLKRLREAKGLTQEALAERAGVSLGAVRQWEQSKRTPLLDAAARVADVLEVTLDELAGRTSSKRGKKK